MWCKNRKKVIKEMKQRGEDPSALLPQPKVEQKPTRNLSRVQSQKEITPSERGRSLPKVSSQRDVPSVERGRSNQSSVSQTLYKDPSLEGTYKDSPVKVNSSRSEPFAKYVKPGGPPSEPIGSAVKHQSVSESYSPVVTHSAPAMPTALLVHPSSLAAVQQQSSTVASVKSSSELPSLAPKQEVSEPPMQHTSATLSVPHSTQQAREPSPEDPTLPLKFMDITQFKAPEDMDDEDKLGDHRHSPGPPTLEPMPTGPVTGGSGSIDPLPPPTLDPDMHQLTSLLQQGGSVEDVARSLNITLDEKTSELLNTLKQQLDLAATLQNKPVLPVIRSSKIDAQQSSLGASKQDSGYSQTSQYGYDSGRYGSTYQEMSYSSLGYGQAGHVSGGEQENETGNSGVKAALANLLAQQGHRVSMGGTEFSQQDPYSQPNPVYSQAHRHDEPFYSKSDQPDFGGTVYHEELTVDPPYSRHPGELPSESITTNTGPVMGISHGGPKPFGYHSDEHMADTSTVDSMSKYGYGQGMGQVPSYGSDSYSSGIDSEGGIGPGSINRRRSSLAATTTSEMGSGEGRGRNTDSGPGFSGHGNFGQRTASFNRSESEGTRSGPSSLLGSPPFRPSLASGSAGKSFGRQGSDEGTPRSKSPGAGLLGSRPGGFGGTQFGMGRGGSNQGPRPLMSFEALRGRNDRGGFRGGWK